jgi:hypothetical protein
MATGHVVVRATSADAGALDERDNNAGMDFEYWVQNSFICVGDPDKMKPAERRSKSLPPIAFIDWCDTLAPPCIDSVEVQRRSSGGKRCKRCRGRKGDRCKCVSKAAAQKALGSDAVEGASPIAKLPPSLLEA